MRRHRSGIIPSDAGRRTYARLQATAVVLRVALLVLVAVAAIALAGPSNAAEDAAQPRLTLPGGHTVRAGQRVDIRWSRADSISELEILLSLDGGRTYSRRISPRLDPSRCEFQWRVPEVGARTVRMRIRFNRGGREIEGAPSAPLLVFAGTTDDPEPLALPPTGDASGPRSENGATEGQIWTLAPRSAARLHDPMQTHATLGDLTAADRSSEALASRSHLFRDISFVRFLPLRI